MPDAWPPGLQALARQYGVQRSFYGLAGKRYAAQPDVVLAVLRELGAELDGPRDIPSALRAQRAEYWRQIAEPVAGLWSGRAGTLEIHLPHMDVRIECTLERDSGEHTGWAVDAGELPTLGAEQIGATRYERKLLTLPADLPPGYHRLHLQAGIHEGSTLLIVAPPRMWRPNPPGRSWGVFAPLYALSSDRSWGAGDLTDLARLTAWAGKLGAQVVATLPLLAASFHDGEISPYAPVSRLFWNELYLDVDQVLAVSQSRSARADQRSETPSPLAPGGSGGSGPPTAIEGWGEGGAQLASRIAALQAQPLVDYDEIMRLKRSVLETTAKAYFGQQAPRDDLAQSTAANPALASYARFRSVWESVGTPWQEWPERLRGGDLREGDGDERVVQYHQFVQWQADQQVRRVAEQSRADGVALYFDLPVGSRRDGFDVWANQDLFAQGLTVGAPPDAGFPSGQAWGFPPIRPDRSRAQGHRYFIDSLRHQLATVGMLRLDHVMGLHRLYCIPEGADKLDGVYVRYPWEEYYAILAVESHRHQAIIVGEDLGIVPREVRVAMARHGLDRTWVLQFELAASGPAGLRDPPATAVAAINTHDTATFAGFWDGTSHDVWERLVEFLTQRGVLDEPDPNLGTVFRACIQWLGRSRADMVLVNLEDLWLEREPQNMPASPPGPPNWRRKARHRLETIESMDDVGAALHALAAARLYAARPSDGGSGTRG